MLIIWPLLDSSRPPAKYVKDAKKEEDHIFFLRFKTQHMVRAALSSYQCAERMLTLKKPGRIRLSL